MVLNWSSMKVRGTAPRWKPTDGSKYARTGSDGGCPSPLAGYRATGQLPGLSESPVHYLTCDYTPECRATRHLHYP